jgi:hypothetical protein
MPAVPTLDLTDEERAALVRFLRDGIDRDRFPLSPRLVPIRTILDKLDPPAPRPPPRRETGPVVPPRAARKGRWR